ncbi:MAG: DUF4783 domain-containing protein [Bacteroidia bacterium]
MKKFIIIPFLTLFLTLPGLVKADIIADIAGAIRSGSAREIAKFFNTNVDLTLLADEEVYSKTQAEQVLQDFLSKNTPRSFTIVHQGVKVGAKYAIGTYVSSQGVTYRVYFFVKQSGTTEVIQDLRFEKE